MSNNLTYYISLGAPPTRRPCNGREEFMRPEIGFNPSWFYKYCNVDFSEKFHTNVEYRYQAYEKMKKEVKKRFPEFSIGMGLGEDTPDLLTGLYGTVVLDAAFGKKISYYHDKWPVCHGDNLTTDEMLNLKVPDLENTWIFQDILRQMDEIEERFGKVLGFLNWQGVLNQAFRLRGQDIFVDMVTEPEAAANLFDVVSKTIIKGTKLIQKRQRKSGVDYNFGNIGNCTANMVSPKMYEKVIYPYDLSIRKEFDDFAIHNCAWSVTDLADVYKNTENLGYLDMGMETDLKKVKNLFPDTRRNVLYKSIDLLNKSEDEIREDFEKIYNQIAPCDIGLPDIEDDVPDEKIKLVIATCEKYNKLEKVNSIIGGKL